MKTILGMCLNPKVLAALGVVAVGVWILAPGFVLAILPILLFAACPLSMIFMARNMRGDMAGHADTQPAARLAELEREQARLTAEIAQVRAQRSATPELSQPRPERALEVKG